MTVLGDRRVPRRLPAAARPDDGPRWRRRGASSRPVSARRRAFLLIERNAHVYRRTWMVLVERLLRAALLPARGRLRHRRARRRRARPGRPADPVRRVRGAGAARRIGDERRDLRGDAQRLLPAQVREDYDAILATPVGPGDIALGEIGWALIRGLLYALGFMVVMVVLGLVSSPLALLADPGGRRRRVRVRRGRDGGHDVDAQLAGLRPRPARGPAAVPVQRHVLPGDRLPAAPRRRSSSSRRSTAASTSSGRSRPGSSGRRSSSTSCTSSRWASSAWPSSSRRLDKLLLK